MNDLKKYLYTYDDDGNVISKKTACFAIGHRKGGTSKTTVSLSLAWTYQKSGLKVLLIDIDPQASSTQLLGVNKVTDYRPNLTASNFSKEGKKARKRLEDDIYDLDDLYGYSTPIEQTESEYHGLSDLLNQTCDTTRPYVTMDDVHKAIVSPTFKEKRLKNIDGQTVWVEEEVPFGFDLLPSSEELADDELYLPFVSQEASPNDVKGKIPPAKLLTYIISVIKESKEYDLILIDCPPSLSIMAVNGMGAADGTIIPCFPDQQSILSLGKIKANLRELKRLDPNQRGIIGVLMSAVDSRSSVLPFIESQIRDDLQLYIFKTSIPKLADAQKSNSVGKTLPQINKRAENAFDALAEEILIRYNDNEEWEKQRKVLSTLEVEAAIETPEFSQIRDSIRAKLAAKGLTGDALDTLSLSRAKAVYEEKVIKKKYTDGELWAKPNTKNIVLNLKQARKENKNG